MDDFCPHNAIVPSEQTKTLGRNSGQKLYDVAIIGAGITGASAALTAATQGIPPHNICILDRSSDLRLLDGASRRSAGKFAPRSNVSLRDLVKTVSAQICSPNEDSTDILLQAEAAVIGITDLLHQGCTLLRRCENNFPRELRSIQEGLLIVNQHMSQQEMADQLTDHIKYGLPERMALSDEEVTAELGARQGIFRSGYIEPLAGSYDPARHMTGLHRGFMRKGVPFFLYADAQKVTKAEDVFVIECSGGSQVRARTVISASVSHPGISEAVFAHTFPLYAHAMSIPLTNDEIMRNIRAATDTASLPFYAQRRGDQLWFGRSDTTDNSMRISRRRAMRHLRLAQRIFPLETIEEVTHWSGVYYQTTNELPIVVQEEKGFFAIGGMGGYGNALGHAVGHIVALQLVALIQNRPNPRAAKIIDFLLSLPRGEKASSEAERKSIIQRLFGGWIQTDEKARRRERRKTNHKKPLRHIVPPTFRPTNNFKTPYMRFRPI